jgi:hemerythrin
MPPVSWTPDLTVHHPLLDDQHKRLFDIATALWHSAEGDAGQADALVQDLVDYTHRHFADEEAILYQIGYPQYVGHAKIHKKIFNTVDVLMDKYASTDRRIFVRELAEFVSEWLVRHIQAEDMSYARFIRRKAAGGG